MKKTRLLISLAVLTLLIGGIAYAQVSGGGVIARLQEIYITTNTFSSDDEFLRVTNESGSGYLIEELNTSGICVYKHSMGTPSANHSACFRGDQFYTSEAPRVGDQVTYTRVALEENNTSSILHGGGCTVAPTGDFNLTRSGDLVTATMDSFGCTKAGSGPVIIGSIPAEYRPNATIQTLVPGTGPGCPDSLLLATWDGSDQFDFYCSDGTDPGVGAFQFGIATGGNTVAFTYSLNVP